MVPDVYVGPLSRRLGTIRARPRLRRAIVEPAAMALEPDSCVRKVKRLGSRHHYLSAPTTQGQSLVGLSELKAPGGTAGSERSHPCPVPPPCASLTPLSPRPCYTLKSVLMWFPAPDRAGSTKQGRFVFGSASGPGNGHPSVS